ncbi:MAG: isochorismatase family protein [Vulcanisaeta sp.]|nr:isochorismatase family protein [Vulcanisaeta sp.]MCG2895033.1 isochorismatase family protein [Vulcanisaeta sp.]
MISLLIRIPSPSLSAQTSSCPLRNSGRYTVVFTGIATDIGIETSARHALVVGDFRTYLKSRLTCALPR